MARQCFSVCVVEKIQGKAKPRALACGTRSAWWSSTWCAPIRTHQSRVSGREAVVTTVSPVSCRASWIAMEPTPPAPPMISTAPLLSLPRAIFSRSNSASQAVIVVSGMAAASAKERLLGLRPTMRSSTTCSSELLPARFTWPA